MAAKTVFLQLHEDARLKTNLNREDIGKFGLMSVFKMNIPSFE